MIGIPPFFPVWTRLAFRALSCGSALALNGASTLAEPWSCEITVECYAGLACVATDRPMEIIAADHEGQLFLASASDAVALTRITGQAYAGAHLLVTISPDGAAQISHHDDAVIISFGHCIAL